VAGARRRDAPTGWPVGVQKKPVLDPFGYRTLTRCGRSTLTPAAAHDELVFTMPGGSVVRLSNWRRAVFIPRVPVPGRATGSASTTYGTPLPR